MARINGYSTRLTDRLRTVVLDHGWFILGYIKTWALKHTAKYTRLSYLGQKVLERYLTGLLVPGIGVCHWDDVVVLQGHVI